MMPAKQPRTRQQEWPGEHPFRIPSASATDRSPPLTPPKSWAWHQQTNGMRIGPSTLGGLRLLAKRPRRRRRERLQGFHHPFEIRIPAKPEHRDATCYLSSNRYQPNPSTGSTSKTEP